MWWCHWVDRWIGSSCTVPGREEEVDRCRQVCKYGGKIRVWLLFSMRKEVVGGLQKVNPMGLGQNGLPALISESIKRSPSLLTYRDTGFLHPNSPPNRCSQGSTPENAAPALLPLTPLAFLPPGSLQSADPCAPSLASHFSSSSLDHCFFQRVFVGPHWDRAGNDTQMFVLEELTSSG